MIAAVAFGTDKRMAILGVLRSGRVNALYTDAETAGWLLRQEGAEKPGA